MSATLNLDAGALIFAVLYSVLRIEFPEEKIEGRTSNELREFFKRRVSGYERRGLTLAVRFSLPNFSSLAPI